MLAHTATDLTKLSKAVTKQPLPVTPTLMRKLVATSVVSSQSESDMNAVANHMTHGVDTSRRHYQNVQGDNNSVHAFELIRASNAGSGTVPEPARACQSLRTVQSPADKTKTHQSRQLSGCGTRRHRHKQWKGTSTSQQPAPRHRRVNSRSS